MTAEEVCRELTAEDLKRPLELVFDVEKLDSEVRNAWLTYIGMRHSLEHFGFLHPEIGPLIIETEGAFAMRSPDRDILGRAIPAVALNAAEAITDDADAAA